MDKLERIKIRVEIIAIVLAGLFAFFTWGIDNSKPSWGLEFANVQHLTAKEVNGTILVCRNKNYEDSPTSIHLSGSFIIRNKGSVPLEVPTSVIEVYVLDKPNIDNKAILNVSPSRSLEQIESSKLKPIATIPISEVDQAVLYGDQKAETFFIGDFTI